MPASTRATSSSASAATRLRTATSSSPWSRRRRRPSSACARRVRPSRWKPPTPTTRPASSAPTRSTSRVGSWGSSGGFDGAHMSATSPAEPVRLIEDEATGDRLLIYGSDRGIRVELRYEGDSLWLSEAQIAELFGVTRQNINTHLNNIYSEGELDRAATCKENLQVRREGRRRVVR